MHSRAVHNAIRVDSLIWLGCLVNNADTEGEDNLPAAKLTPGVSNQDQIHCCSQGQP